MRTVILQFYIACKPKKMFVSWSFSHNRSYLNFQATPWFQIYYKTVENLLTSICSGGTMNNIMNAPWQTVRRTLATCGRCRGSCTVAGIDPSCAPEQAIDDWLNSDYGTYLKVDEQVVGLAVAVTRRQMKQLNVNIFVSLDLCISNWASNQRFWNSCDTPMRLALLGFFFPFLTKIINLKIWALPAASQSNVQLRITVVMKWRQLS